MVGCRAAELVTLRGAARFIALAFALGASLGGTRIAAGNEADPAAGAAEADADAQPPALARAVTGGVHVVRVRSGDSLTAIAARWGVSLSGLARGNDLSIEAPLAVDRVLRVEGVHVVPAVFETLAPDTILVNVPQRMLFERRGGSLVGAYPIAAGRPSWPTPLGAFTVDARATDKPWIVPARIQAELRSLGKPAPKIVPPGPDNPLGRHWLGLSRSSIGIHGTNAPSSIYALRTHGCIRLHPDDIESLYGRSAIGDPVEIVYESVLLAQPSDERICLEVHPDAYGRSGSGLARVEALAAGAHLTARIDWGRVTEILAAKEGIARDVTRGGAGGICALPEAEPATTPAPSPTPAPAPTTAPEERPSPAEPPA